MDAGSLYLTRNKIRTTRHQLNRTIWFGLALVMLKHLIATYVSEIIEGPEHVCICKSTRASRQVYTIKDCID